MFNKENILKKLFQKHSVADALVLLIFTILITYQPHYAHGRINTFEVGLYLPGIKAILHGLIPYRDFFYLRGPLELFVPAALMKLSTEHINILYLYFYVGSVACLLLCVLIAREIIKTRLMYYLLTFVLVARTFPRVVFTYWGGMRYAYGLIALYCAIKFIKKNNGKWMFWSGVFCAVGLFTSLEIGIIALLATMSAVSFSYFLKVQDGYLVTRGFSSLFKGFLIVTFGMIAYLLVTGSLFGFLNSQYVVVTQLQSTFTSYATNSCPGNIIEVLFAMINPLHANFKHMTPAYLYLFLFVFMILKLKEQKPFKDDITLMSIFVYGLVMYHLAFRNIWASQFEMALQPQKILLFVFLEIFLLKFYSQRQTLISSIELKNIVDWQDPKRLKLMAINIFLFILIGSSLGYSLQRYNHRFFAFQYLRNKIFFKSVDTLKPYDKTNYRETSIAPIKNVYIPNSQADELESLCAYFDDNAEDNEKILFYPEMGAYYFFCDKSFASRFPMGTFAWLSDVWHDQMMQSLDQDPPRIIILPKRLDDKFEQAYFKVEKNKQSHDALMQYVESNYRYEDSTVGHDVYLKKSEDVF